MTIRHTLAALTCAALTLATLTPQAQASPEEFELETVESLLIDTTCTDDERNTTTGLCPDNRPFFLFSAPAASCDNQGTTQYNGCPDITWTCPDGITDGALNRLQRTLTYDQAVAGYQARDTMCLPQGGSALPATQTDVFVDSAGNTCRNVRDVAGVIINIVCNSAPATPATPAIDPPEIAFTGSESTTLAYMGTGLIAFGALALGTRRRIQK